MQSAQRSSNASAVARREQPIRILIPPERRWAFDGHLEDTGFTVALERGLSSPRTSS